MRIKKVDPDQLIVDRYNLMRKGFLNRKEVMSFVPCGTKMANMIVDDIRKEVALEGYENLDENLILAKRIIAYLGLTEKKIESAYEALKKAPSADQSKSAQKVDM